MRHRTLPSVCGYRFRGRKELRKAIESAPEEALRGFPAAVAECQLKALVEKRSGAGGAQRRHLRAVEIRKRYDRGEATLEEVKAAKEDLTEIITPEVLARVALYVSWPIRKQAIAVCELATECEQHYQAYVDSSFTESLANSRWQTMIEKRVREHEVKEAREVFGHPDEYLGPPIDEEGMTIEPPDLPSPSVGSIDPDKDPPF